MWTVSTASLWWKQSKFYPAAAVPTGSGLVARVLVLSKVKYADVLLAGKPQKQLLGPKNFVEINSPIKIAIESNAHILAILQDDQALCFAWSLQAMLDEKIDFGFAALGLKPKSGGAQLPLLTISSPWDFAAFQEFEEFPGPLSLIQLRRVLARRHAVALWAYHAQTDQTMSFLKNTLPASEWLGTGLPLTAKLANNFQGQLIPWRLHIESLTSGGLGAIVGEVDDVTVPADTWLSTPQPPNWSFDGVQDQEPNGLQPDASSWFRNCLAMRFLSSDGKNAYHTGWLWDTNPLVGLRYGLDLLLESVRPSDILDLYNSAILFDAAHGVVADWLCKHEFAEVMAVESDSLPTNNTTLVGHHCGPRHELSKGNFQVPSLRSFLAFRKGNRMQLASAAVAVCRAIFIPLRLRVERSLAIRVGPNLNGQFLFINRGAYEDLILPPTKGFNIAGQQVPTLHTWTTPSKHPSDSSTYMAEALNPDGAEFAALPWALETVKKLEGPKPPAFGSSMLRMRPVLSCAGWKHEIDAPEIFCSGRYGTIGTRPLCPSLTLGNAKERLVELIYDMLLQSMVNFLANLSIGSPSLPVEFTVSNETVSVYRCKDFLVWDEYFIKFTQDCIGNWVASVLPKLQDKGIVPFNSAPLAMTASMEPLGRDATSRLMLMRVWATKFIALYAWIYGAEKAAFTGGVNSSGYHMVPAEYFDRRAEALACSRDYFRWFLPHEGQKLVDYSGTFYLYTASEGWEKASKFCPPSQMPFDIMVSVDHWAIKAGAQVAPLELFPSVSATVGNQCYYFLAWAATRTLAFYMLNCSPPDKSFEALLTKWGKQLP